MDFSLSERMVWALRAMAPDRTDLELLTRYGRTFPVLATEQPKRGPMGQCFVNATRLSLYFGLYYCEGYAASKTTQIPLPHAWCVDRNGHVHDPTWPHGADYFGICFKRREFARILNRTRHYGVLHHLDLLDLPDPQAVQAFIGPCTVPSVDALNGIEA